MRTKILVLGLACLFIFSFCEKGVENPHSPVYTPPIVVLNPLTIVSFTSSNPDKDRFITISWEVENATSIWLQTPYNAPYQWDVSHLPIGSVDHEVCGLSTWDAVTMTYALSATNDDGSVREEIEVVSASAVLEITAIPEVVVHGALFDVIVTETYGVGGYAIIRLHREHCGGTWYKEQRKTFLPFETWYIGRDIDSSPFTTYLCIQALVDDDNGFWTEPSALIFLRGPN